MSDDDDVSAAHPIRPQEASAQATEYLGFLGSVVYDLGGGESWELPSPSLMPPDMKMRYLEHLRFMSEDLDTKPRENPVTKEIDQIQVYPLRYKKKLVNDEELLCVALMGGDEDYARYLKDRTLPSVYAKFLAAGGRPGQVGTAWQMMGRQMQERAQRDPKSR